MAVFTPSKYQQAVYDFDPVSSGHAVIEAVAGSGKSTTIIEKSNRMNSAGLKMLFLAFNASIVKELKGRLPDSMTVLTTHSLGLRISSNMNGGRVKVDDKDEKLKYIVSRVLANRRLSKPEYFQFMGHIKRATGMIMNTLTDYNNPVAVNTMLNRYGIDLNSQYDLVMETLPSVMAMILADGNVINFDEMIYRPAMAVINGTAVMPQYDVILIDETQDLSASQIALVKGLASNGGKIIAVGDSKQSIYGFRGADSESMPRLVSELNAATLPLSICYRCPISHLDLARKFVPAIEARDNAPTGQVLTMPLDKVVADGYFKRGETLAISRINAPLVGAALRLIRTGIPAIVLGRDIGDNLISLINKVNSDGLNVSDFMTALRLYHVNETIKLKARDASDSLMQSLEDRIETVYAVSDGAQTVDEISGRIKTIFSDVNEKGAVEFSSVHKAKGREAKTVVIIAPDKLPLKVKTDWERQQEANIEYVAMTRAKDTLIFAQ